MRWSIGRFIRKIHFTAFSSAGKYRAKGQVKLYRFVLSAILLVAGVIWLSMYFRPALLQMAAVRVDNLAVRAINNAINSRVIDEKIEYENLIVFEKDIYGQITALKTDMMAINRLKTGVSSDVLEELMSIEAYQLAIPLGNLARGELFSGRGPRIPVKIVPLGVVHTDFSNAFITAGINQTRHQVMINIAVDIDILLPGRSTERRVETQVCVAETVIVGSVPDSYLNLTPPNFSATE
ncbi:MAG: sporulation protein YunB [Oscillospiraceae bacterium]|nr:sporulation protein YunB [Oscillospiraceae bacterium]